MFENRRSFQYVSDAGQSKCRVERNQALEQARRPQSSESMFIPECNEDGTFAQVRIRSSVAFSFPFKSFTLHLSLSISLMCTPLFRSPQNLAFSSRTERSTPCSLFTLPCVLPLPRVLPLQVQCHTLTGYCWCVTSDGKPVSGSSVHNRTPVCSGTK